MKLLFLILFSNFVAYFPDYPNKEEAMSGTLSWASNRSLTWDDFKGTPNEKSPFAAECNWEIKYFYSFNETRNEKFLFDVYCYFNKSKSWVKESEASNDLLKHEQLHFDIAELCSRRLRKSLIEAQFSKDGFKKEINLIFAKTLHECDSIQSHYDDNTNHGLNKIEQKNWDKSIHISLKDLDLYNYNNFSHSLNTPVVQNHALINKLFKKLF